MKAIEEMSVQEYNDYIDSLGAVSQLKSIGKEYNGYQVPLDEEAQIAVTSVAVQYIAGLFTGTVFHFSNGTKMPCSAEDFMQFAQWFAVERNRFFTDGI